jgi:hypothetical protein
VRDLLVQRLDLDGTQCPADAVSELEHEHHRRVYACLPLANRRAIGYRR